MNDKGYLLDTNVLSETRRRIADARVMEFLSAAEPSALFLSVLALGELRKGIALKRRSDAEAAERLSEWVDGLELSFADRLIGIDGAVARAWGELAAERPRPVVDTLMAATAMVHGLTLVTRNIGDVQDVRGLHVLNPWEDGL